MQSSKMCLDMFLAYWLNRNEVFNLTALIVI
jgi:hypothetical protein